MIFFMKLEVHNMKELTEADFLAKILVWPILDKKCQKWPKKRVFGHFQKIQSLILAGHGLKQKKL